MKFEEFKGGSQNDVFHDLSNWNGTSVNPKMPHSGLAGLNFEWITRRDKGTNDTKSHLRKDESGHWKTI